MPPLATIFCILTAAGAVGFSVWWELAHPYRPGVNDMRRRQLDRLIRDQRVDHG